MSVSRRIPSLPPMARRGETGRVGRTHIDPGCPRDSVMLFVKPRGSMGGFILPSKRRAARDISPLPPDCCNIIQTPLTLNTPRHIARHCENEEQRCPRTDYSRLCRPRLPCLRLHRPLRYRNAPPDARLHLNLVRLKINLVARFVNRLPEQCVQCIHSRVGTDNRPTASRSTSCCVFLSAASACGTARTTPSRRNGQRIPLGFGAPVSTTAASCWLIGEG
jgi:hypothetical protein